MSIIPLITAFGLGSVIAAMIQFWLSQRTENIKRNFQEKKECYIGLLEAYHRAAVENTDQASQNFAYWQMRCEMVAPEQVRKAIQEIVNTNDDRDRRNIAHENLKNVLRRDIGISK